MSLKNFLTSKTFFTQVLIAVLILIVVIFALLHWLDYTTNHDQKISVPNLAKMNVEDAGKKLEENDLEVIVLDTVDFNPEFPPYTITEQDPLAKANVKEGRKVYVKINAGSYSNIMVPDLIQKTLRQAEPMLKGAGLEIGEKTYVPYLAKDVVLEMKYKNKNLKAGDKVRKASKIDLVLGDGKTGYEEQDSTEVEVNP